MGRRCLNSFRIACARSRHVHAPRDLQQGEGEDDHGPPDPHDEANIEAKFKRGGGAPARAEIRRSAGSTGQLHQGAGTSILYVWP